jgi:hypothetical protein
VTVRGAGSGLVARAFASRKVLFGGTSTTEVQIGRASRTSVGPGKVAFAITLAASGQRALRRRARLLIRVRMTIDPVTGATYRGSRLVVLHAQ